MTAEVDEDTPRWFTDAIATQPDHGFLVVDGARIAYRAWGEPGAPGLVLVHGGAAHSGWWDHIAPNFAQTRRVVAPDLSGHGDSEWRDAYSLSIWSREVMAVATAARADRRPVVAGHSLGGLVAMHAALSHPDLVQDLMLVDSRIHDDDSLAEMQRAAGDDPHGISRATRHYPTRAAAVSRYRLVPPGDSLDYLRDHVAHQSVIRDERGWRWKFDRGFSDNLADLPSPPPQQCRLTVVHGEHGVMTAGMAERLGAHLDTPAHIVEFAGAGHHIPLERPLELIDIIDDALARQTRDGTAGGGLSQG